MPFSPWDEEEDQFKKPEEATPEYNVTGPAIDLTSIVRGATAPTPAPAVPVPESPGQPDWRNFIDLAPGEEGKTKAPATPVTGEGTPDWKGFLEVHPEKTGMEPSQDQRIQANRIDALLTKSAQEKEAAPERGLVGEIGAGLGRGAVGILELPVEVAKIVGADVLKSKTVQEVLEPVLWKMEQWKQNPTLRPGKQAQTTPIDLDQVLNDPKKVASQVVDAASNAYWWASQVPEQIGPWAIMAGGGWLARLAGSALKWGRLAKEAEGAAVAARVAGNFAEAEFLSGKAATYVTKLDKLQKIGTYGAAVALEAAEGESRLREYELTHKDVDWGKRVAAILATGFGAGALEAMSFEKIFSGKNGMNLAKKILEGIVTEGSTEGAQTLVENAAQKYGYDPDQKLTEGIIESVLIGAVLGGAGGGVEHVRERIHQNLVKARDEEIRAAYGASDLGRADEAAAYAEARGWRGLSGEEAQAGPGAGGPTGPVPPGSWETRNQPQPGPAPAPGEEEGGPGMEPTAGPGGPEPGPATGPAATGPMETGGEAATEESTRAVGPAPGPEVAPGGPVVEPGPTAGPQVEPGPVGGPAVEPPGESSGEVGQGPQGPVAPEGPPPGEVPSGGVVDETENRRQTAHQELEGIGLPKDYLGPFRQEVNEAATPTEIDAIIEDARAVKEMLDKQAGVAPGGEAAVPGGETPGEGSAQTITEQTREPEVPGPEAAAPAAEGAPGVAPTATPEVDAAREDARRRLDEAKEKWEGNGPPLERAKQWLDKFDTVDEIEAFVSEMEKHPAHRTPMTEEEANFINTQEKPPTENYERKAGNYPNEFDLATLIKNDYRGKKGEAAPGITPATEEGVRPAPEGGAAPGPEAGPKPGGEKIPGGERAPGGGEQAGPKVTQEETQPKEGTQAEPREKTPKEEAPGVPATTEAAAHEDSKESVRLSKELEPLLAKAVWGEQPQPLKKETVIAKAKKILGIKTQEQLTKYRKVIEEALELAQVNQARKALAADEAAGVAIEKTLQDLIRLYNHTPILSTRTSETVLAQAYSTPVPLAYLMSKATGITENTKVYEPTAGNGILLIGAKPGNVLANELNQTRVDHLKSQGFTVTENNAAEFVPQAKVDVVVMNPPFGTIKATTYDGFKITKLEHLIVLKALEAMKDNGRAAIIIGGHSFFDNMGNPVKALTATDRTFFNYLYSRYRVTAHINIDRKIYGRMGTTWPIRLLVVDGRKAVHEGVAPYSADQVDNAKTFEEIHELLKGDIEDAATRGTEEGPVGPGVSEGEQPGERGPGGPGEAGAGTEGGAGLPAPVGAEGQRPVGETPGGRGPGASPGEPGGTGGLGGEQPGTSPGGGGPTGGPGTVERPGGRPGQPGPEGEGQGGGEVPPGRGGEQPGGGEGTAGAKPGDTTGGATPGVEKEGKPEGEKAKKPKKEKTPESPEERAEKERLKRETKLVNKIILDVEEWIKQEGWKEHGHDSLGKFIKSLSEENRKKIMAAIIAMNREASDPEFKKQQDEKREKAGERPKEAPSKSFTERIMEEFEQEFGNDPEWERMRREGNKKGETEYWEDVINEARKQAEEEAGAEKVRKAQAQATELQDNYEPASKGESLNTVAPKKMREAMSAAVARFEEIHGRVDAYVLEKLQFKSMQDLYNVLAAEQIETVALTIAEIERGQGFIVGHQTGVGKGRCCAAVLRYARLRGLKPIFITKQGSLFNEMMRDLRDINSGDFVPFMLASDSNEAVIFEEDGETIKYKLDAKFLKIQKAAINSRTLPQEYDGIFTTYSQFNDNFIGPTGTKFTAKQSFLSQMAQGNIIILDESHDAAGADTGKGQRRGQTLGSNTCLFTIHALLPHAVGVQYSSASFAKRPGSMPVYFRTAIGNARIPLDQLISTVMRLGVPGQEWMSQQLSLEGQMSRLETSYAGIHVHSQIDNTNRERDVNRADSVTQYLRNIVDLDRYKSAVLDGIRSELATTGGGASGQSMQPHVTSTTFASRVHNAIDQMMYSLRSELTVDKAVDLLTQKEMVSPTGEVQKFPNGQKPFVTIFNTMDALVQHVVDEGIVKEGDVFDPDFRQVLSKNLESILYYTVQMPNGRKERRKITPDQMLRYAPEMFRGYNVLKENIRGAEELASISAMPIDFMKREIKRRAEARFKEMGIDREINVGEVTGRKWHLEEDDKQPGLYRLRVRQKGTKDSNQAMFRNYNNGKLDVLLVNTSGFTGMSAHANAKFKDHTPRAMVCTQLPYDINMVMQAMGRINRTGQVALPSYHFATLAMPNEYRPLMILQRKLKSLSANVSADASTWVKLNVEDILNHFGDEALAQVLIDDLQEEGDWYWRLNDPLHLVQTNPDGSTRIATPQPAHEYRAGGNLVSRVTGYMALQPVATQEAMWDEINKKYTEFVEYYKQSGEYNLESESLDLQAESLSKEILVHMEGSGYSSLSGPCFIEKVNAKMLTKPYKAAELQTFLDTNLGDYKQKIEEKRQEAAERLERAQADYKAADEAHDQAYRDYYKVRDRNWTIDKEITEARAKQERAQAAVNNARKPEEIQADIHDFREMARAATDEANRERYELRAEKAERELQDLETLGHRVEEAQNQAEALRKEKEELPKRQEELKKVKDEAKEQVEKAREEQVAAEEYQRAFRGENAAGVLYSRDLADKIETEAMAWLEERLQRITDPNGRELFKQNAEQAIKDTTDAIRRRWHIGQSYTMNIGQVTARLVLYKIAYNPGHKGNPATPSNITLFWAINSPMRQHKLPMSRLHEWSIQRTGEDYLKRWDELIPQTGIEERYIVTGNILLSPQQFMEAARNRARGRMTFFTRKDGSIDAGILMPREFRAGEINDIPIPLSPDEVRVVLEHLGDMRYEARDILLLKYPGQNYFYFWIPKAKAKGEAFYSDPEIIALTEAGRFYERGRNYSAKIPNERLQRLVTILKEKHGITFTITRNAYQQIFGRAAGPGTGQAHQEQKILKGPGWGQIAQELAKLRTVKQFNEVRLEEINLAYGSKEKYDQAMREVAKDIQEVTEKLQGAGAEAKVGRELRVARRIDLTGRKLTAGQEAVELAQIWQVYRNTKMEIMHAVFTKNGQIVAHNAITCGLIDMVGPTDMAKYAHQLKNQAERLGADQVHIIHNHPSGDATMSRNDMMVAHHLRAGFFNPRTDTWAITGLGPLMGQFVVIDHGHYSYVSPYGHMATEQLPGTPNNWKEGRSFLQNMQDVAFFGNFLQYAPDKFVAIYVTHSLEVRGWAVHQKTMLDKGDPGEVRKAFEQEIKRRQAGGVIVLSDDSNLVARFLNRHILSIMQDPSKWDARNQFHRWLFDIVSSDGKSTRNTDALKALWDPMNINPKSRSLFETALKYVQGGRTQYDFSVSGGVNRGPAYTRADIQKFFPGLKVYTAGETKGVLPDSFMVELRNGKVIGIVLNKDIVKPSLAQIRQTYGPEVSEEDYAERYVQGEWTSMGVGGLVTLAKIHEATTLLHELFHGACDLVLTQKELDTLLKEFGNWEAAARAYQNWNPKEPHGIFAKIMAFFRNLAAYLKPNTAEDIFARIRSGEVWLRTEVGPGMGGTRERFSLARTADLDYVDHYAQTHVHVEPKIKVEFTPGFVQKAYADSKGWFADKWKRFYREMVSEVAAIETVSREAAQKVRTGMNLLPGQIPELAATAYRGNRAISDQDIMGAPNQGGVFHDEVTAGVVTKEVQELQEQWSQEMEEKGQVSERTEEKLAKALARTFFTGESVRVGESLNTRLEPLRELAKRHGEQVWDHFWHVFMVAQRDLELAGEHGNRLPGEIKGVSPEESREALTRLRNIYGQDFQTFHEVAGQVREWADQAILQRLKLVGLMSQETYDAIRQSNQFYTPFFRIMEEMEERGYIANNANLFEVRAIPVKEIKGSERKIVDPLESLIKLCYNTNDIYGRAKVARTLMELPLFTETPGIERVRAKYFKVPVMLKAEVDPVLRQGLEGLMRSLGVDVKVKARLKEVRRELGFFRKAVGEESLEREEVGFIMTMFASTEKTLAHQVGHAIDAIYDLKEVLMENLAMRKELRVLADQRVGDTNSRSFRRYVRGKNEQVAEFLNRYINANENCRAVAPNATAAFEAFVQQHPDLHGLLTLRPSHQIGIREFEDTAWVRSAFAPEKNAVLVHLNGKAYWVKLDPDLAQAVKSMTAHEVGILLKILRAPASYLRAGAVLSPEFIARNWFRDVIQAKMLSRYGFSLRGWVTDAFRVLKSDEEAMKIWAQWEAGGGPFGTSVAALVDLPKVNAENIKGGGTRKIYYCAHPLEVLRAISGFFENITRYSVYRQAKEKGYSHAEAINFARTDTIDFARHGAHPIARALAMMIPFWGANVQGIDRMAQALTDPQQRPVVMRRLLLGLALPSIMLWLFTHKDKRIKELEDWERNYFWHIPLGSDGPILRLPKPFELGIGFGSTFERMLGWAVDNDVRGVQKVFGALYDALTPNLLPAAARPFVEGMSNWNFFGGHPIEDASVQILPKELRDKPWTLQLSKATARGLAQIVPEWMKISPIMMEHFIRSMGGGLAANYLYPGMDLALRKAGVLDDIPDPQKELVQQLWGVRAYFSREPTGMRARSMGQFFERYQSIIEADQGWKHWWNSGNPKEAEVFLKEHPVAIFAKVSRKLMSELGKIKKERNKIYESRVLSSEEKKERLDRLDAKALRITQFGNAFIDDDIADLVKIPSRFRVAPNKKTGAIDLPDYYNLIAGATYDAFQKVSPALGGLVDKDVETRTHRIAMEINTALAEYQPILKKEAEVEMPFRFKDLFDTPTHQEKSEWQSLLGTRGRLPSGIVSGYRLKEEKKGVFGL